MSQNDFNQWSADKAKELFSISHKLMEAAKQLGEQHAAELKVNIDLAMELAKATAKNDFEHVKKMQAKAAEEALDRLTAYQARVKTILKQINKDTVEEAEKHLEKARDSLNEYMEQVAKKVPMGGAELSKLVKNMSEAGTKVYKEGRKVIDQALEQADHKAEEVMQKATASRKASAVKTATKTSAKTTARKTTR
jgi:uncharacterized membrane protein